MKNGDARLQVPDFIEPKDFLPVEVNRPPYLHRYDLFSPKLSRRLTLFSWNAVLLWTMIESHPTIKTFCERPGFVHVHGDWRIADFWVQREGRSEFLLLEHSPLQNLVGVAPHLESDLGLRARTVFDTELEAHATWIKNWQQILPYLVSNLSFVEPRQLDRILNFCQISQMLFDIERAELPGDPVITRTAVFELVRQGKLSAEDLHCDPLSATSRFIKGRTHVETIDH
jgi:hypothetical protein